MNHNSASVYLTTVKQRAGSEKKKKKKNQEPQEACRVSHKRLLTGSKQDNKKRGRNRKREKNRTKNI